MNDTFPMKISKFNPKNHTFDMENYLIDSLPIWYDIMSGISLKTIKKGYFVFQNRW
jgi:hypothetical protein